MESIEYLKRFLHGDVDAHVPLPYIAWFCMSVLPPWIVLLPLTVWMFARPWQCVQLLPGIVTGLTIKLKRETLEQSAGSGSFRTTVMDSWAVRSYSGEALGQTGTVRYNRSESGRELSPIAEQEDADSHEAAHKSYSVTQSQPLHRTRSGQSRNSGPSSPARSSYHQLHALESERSIPSNADELPAALVVHFKGTFVVHPSPRRLLLCLWTALCFILINLWDSTVISRVGYVEVPALMACGGQCSCYYTTLDLAALTPVSLRFFPLRHCGLNDDNIHPPEATFYVCFQYVFTVRLAFQSVAIGTAQLCFFVYFICNAAMPPKVQPEALDSTLNKVRSYLPTLTFLILVVVAVCLNLRLYGSFITMLESFLFLPYMSLLAASICEVRRSATQFYLEGLTPEERDGMTEHEIAHQKLKRMSTLDALPEEFFA
eukprot:gnl/TRDRNA2_/TRDRNA2_45426_c0_seq1.p1 gnl/TRDRNA2_/TRDRNA2_45426_c0~~gnl/TRDRNA2_/TRDRNA2_45426_c0_seq1.p1  ORF type:complete len:430 (-),score=32.90 gnl/TRDRNA2_/TRDRNA2_45426_c0_seq1:39-1328(-)